MFIDGAGVVVTMDVNDFRRLFFLKTSKNKPNKPETNNPAKIPINIKKYSQPIVFGNQIIIIGITYFSKGFVTNQLYTYHPL